MHRHFEDRLDEISEAVLRMGGLVEEAIRRSVRSLVDRDSILAEQVVDEDSELDRLENEIERLTLEALALQQPLARDLRFLATAMKITTDLERMGDLAVNVAERAIELNLEPPLKPFFDIPLMARRAQEMVHGSLDAFVNRDADEARRVIALDDDLDDRMERVFRELVAYMVEDPQSISRALRLSFVSKYFERMGDQATNVCEQVVYMIEGQVIKHARIAGETKTTRE